jgi:hypothetical protein
LQDEGVLKEGVDGLMARELERHQGGSAGHLRDGGAGDGEDAGGWE